MLTRAVIACRGKKNRQLLRSVVHGLGPTVEVLEPGDDLWQRLSSAMADLILVERDLIPEPMPQSIGILRQTPDSPDVLVLFEGADAHQSASLRAAGCEAVLAISLGREILRDVCSTVLARRRVLTAGRGPADQPRLSDFVSASPAMQTFMEVVERVVDTDTSLLLLGETGVGKERLARAIHVEGPRARAPFVAVNCAAIPESLLESELFGHQEGAFTGATRSRRGWFELAHEGTLFLDEIGEMPLHLQAKLLRVLQQREILPVGAERAIAIDVRLMTATNRDLEQAARTGAFRSDLYYRLGVISLWLPALRDRCEDIPALVESYLEHFSRAVRKPITGISEAGMDALARYDWPGNVRELMNVIERAVILSAQETLHLCDLPENFAGRPPALPGGLAIQARPEAVELLPPEWFERRWSDVRELALDSVERTYLAGLLTATHGNIGRTAERAGMSPRSLYEKMRHHGLRKEDYR